VPSIGYDLNRYASIIAISWRADTQVSPYPVYSLTVGAITVRLPPRNGIEVEMALTDNYRCSEK